LETQVFLRESKGVCCGDRVAQVLYYVEQLRFLGGADGFSGRIYILGSDLFAVRSGDAVREEQVTLPVGDFVELN
jgi:hypothetical protein